MTTEETTMTTKIASADAREAGAKIVHTVYVDGVPVAERRSAHRYHWAICRWITAGDGTRTVVVVRWSRSAKAGASQFAVHIVGV
jgi:hypothetical protein